MAYHVVPLVKLIEQFERLPGIGRKSAQRLAFYVLNLPRDKAQQFADAIVEAHDKIKKCSICQSLTETEVCPICSDQSRDASTICVVENSQDVLAFERTREYKGLYHVLHCLISPMDGIGPEQLHIKELLARISAGGVDEVIVGGESGDGARCCDYAWVLDLRRQCIEHGTAFSYHQTGARLIKNGRIYNIPRAHQLSQAKRARIDWSAR